MRGRVLNLLVFFFAVVLGFVLFVSDTSISGFMEACGDVIAQALGL
jgi:hypothetical protein